MFVYKEKEDFLIAWPPNRGVPLNRRPSLWLPRPGIRGEGPSLGPTAYNVLQSMALWTFYLKGFRNMNHQS
jgi:hypothetical protein